MNFSVQFFFIFLSILNLVHFVDPAQHIYHNQFAVHIPAGKSSADLIASKHGFINIGQIGSLDNHFLFEHPRIAKRSTDKSHSHHETFENDPEILWFEQQKELHRKKRDISVAEINIPDPLFRYQWFLNGGAIDGSDMNVKAAWLQGYTGKGVTVTILDDGIQTNHPDLAQNYDPDASTDINDNDNDPMPKNNGDNKHGTRCAGEVAAVAFNEYCGVGIAYNASIGGVRMLDGMVNDAVEARALSLNPDHIDIYSASWGPEDDGKTVDGPGPLAKKAFINGIANGRKKLGSIFVWASGNGGRKTDNCNCDGYTNSIFTLSISSATQGGRKPWYLEECSSTLATTYSSGTPSHDASITTVDQDGDLRPDRICTSSHTGTSASAPIAAGICALALQANPNLTWRDMQHLVVLTANPTPLQVEDGWAINGVGRHYSHKFGYGLMDAGAMVDLALRWPGIGKQLICETEKKVPHLRLSTRLGEINLVTMESNGCAGTSNNVRYLEHVQCLISIRHFPRGSLNLLLVSPLGTRSSILMPRPKDMTDAGFEDWPFLSVHFWGEPAAGNWSLEVSQSELDGSKMGNGKEVGMLVSWQLVFFGTDMHPMSEDEEGEQPPDNLEQAEEEEEELDQNTNEIDGGVTWEVANSDNPVEYQSVGNGEHCHSECLHGCNGGKGSHQCLGCRNFIFESRCVTRCPAGSYATIDRACSRCHRDCVTCYGPGKRQCLTCKPKGENRMYIDVTRNGFCVTKCQPGFFAQNATTCVECASHCDACSDDGRICTSCSRNFVLSSDKKCIPTCPEGQFQDPATRSCLPCHETCATCVGPRASQCGLCRDNSFYYERSCVDKCPKGFVADLASRECSPCPHGCESCASENECLQCQENWQIAVVQSPNKGSSIHLVCVPSKKGPSCEDNRTYFAEAKGQCEKCHPSCDSCFKGDDQSCLSCGHDHYLHITSCVDRVCPNATYLSDATECRHCPHACSVCSSPKACLRCHLGYFLSVSGQCLTGCPDGQKPDAEGRCRPCLSGCKTCAELSGSDFCTACNVDQVLLNGNCLGACPEGFYRDRDSCRRCHPSCLSCSGPETTECLACRPGWAQNGTCLPCSIGQYFEGSSSKCVECFKDCLTCSGPQSSDCDICRSPYLMDPLNRTCVTCCTDVKSDAKLCCDCNAKRDACIVTKTSDEEEERNTRKRSSWSNNSESLQHSSSVTFLIVVCIFVASLAAVVVWRRCRRKDGKRRFRFREGRIRSRNRVPKSPPSNSRSSGPVYEKLPLSENGCHQVNVDDDSSSCSDDEFYLRTSSNGIGEERRRLVTSGSGEMKTSTIDT